MTNNENQVSVFGLVIKDGKLNKIGNEANETLRVKYGTKQLLFIGQETFLRIF